MTVLQHVEWESFDKLVEDDLSRELEDTTKAAKEEFEKLERKQTLEAIRQICTQMQQNL